MRKLNYEYEAEWKKLGYRANMASGKIMLPPAAKFRRVYYFLSADHAISNIALQRLKTARASGMNDPYELFPFHRVGEMRTVLDETKKYADDHFRFLCFSADWGSPAMWAHYADKHQGICLGLDILRVNEMRVRYRKTRIDGSLPVAPFTEAKMRPFVKKIVTLKCNDWRYEEEIRAIPPVGETFREGNLDFIRFDIPRLQLAEVILGLACTRSVEAIRSFVTEKCPNAYVFRTREAHKHFRMVPDENTCAWLPEKARPA